MANLQRQEVLPKRLNRPSILNKQNSLSTKGSVIPPLKDGQIRVVSIDRNDDMRLMDLSKSKRESLHGKAARKKTTAKTQERDTKKKSCYANWTDTCAMNKDKSTQNHSTVGVKEPSYHVTGGKKTQHKKTRTHSTSKPMRSRKASHLDCAIPVSDLKQTHPKEGRAILAECEESEFEDSHCPSARIPVDSTHAKPATTPRERLLGRCSLPPLQDHPLARPSLLHSAAPPLTPNSAGWLTRKLPVSPSVAQAEFSFDDNTRERKRHGKLPPLSLPQREPTLVVVPPTPTTKKPGFLPKLNPIRSSLSSTLSTSSKSEQFQFLSQSAPSNCGEHSILFTPVHSSKSAFEFSFPTCHNPSHLSSQSLNLSDSSVSSLNSPSCMSPWSSSSAFSSSSSPFKYDGDVDEVFCHYPIPPPTSSKKSNNQRRRRPGRRLVPLNKVDSLPLKLDSTVADNLEDIEEVQSCSPKSSARGSESAETNYDEDSEFLKEYLRIRPGRRGAMCEKLEKNMNIVKINGKKYNLTTLRHELTEMMNAVKKYDTFFKTLKFFR